MSSEWYEFIGRPKFVVAPMVDASELAWRLLCRRHGAQLCYTPMFHSNVFIKDPKYRKDNFVTCEEDRPLIVQFCGNNPEVMAAAAKYVEKYCDAIDINLGCPQLIAKRGRYGSFLQDDWDLLANIGIFVIVQLTLQQIQINYVIQSALCQCSGLICLIIKGGTSQYYLCNNLSTITKKYLQTMSKSVSVPITCKVRIFESIEKTVQYALMLQNAGCKLLTVHGRTREQKGPLTGIASWKHLKAVREAISIPMFANGNIQCVEDVYRCLEYTNVDGVMSAEGTLTNPAIYEGVNPLVWEMADEYLDLVEKYPCPSSYIRGHLFKILHKIFTIEDNFDDRQLLATAQNLDDFKKVSTNVKCKYLPYHQGKIHFEDGENLYTNGYNLILPPWICQPYVRMSPEKHIKKMEELSKNQNNDKRICEDSEGCVISRKKIKKLKRIMRRPIKPDSQQHRRNHETCVKDTCPNPLGGKCTYQYCKKCCRDKCYEENLDCKGHRILVRTRREIAKNFEQNDTNN